MYHSQHALTHTHTLVQFNTTTTNTNEEQGVVHRKRSNYRLLTTKSTKLC